MIFCYHYYQLLLVITSADGKFEVQFPSNVLIYNTGYVMWVPCTIYKSSCSIDVEYFPFDEQTCTLIFGSWTYNGDEVTIRPYTDRFLKVCYEETSFHWRRRDTGARPIPSTFNCLIFQVTSEPHKLWHSTLSGFLCSKNQYTGSVFCIILGHQLRS